MLKIAGVGHDYVDKETIIGENIQNEIVKKHGYNNLKALLI
jgi:hypothetical protein